MKSEKRFTVSVIGGGKGGNLSIKALINSSRFILKAIADLNPVVCKTLKDSYPGVKIFTDYLEMFNVCPTDIVCVSTFPSSHEKIAIDALTMLPLKGILVEKPLGNSVASGRKILELVKKKNIPMTVPHGMLQQKSTVEILKRVKAGEIGKLKLVEIQCLKWDIINAGIHWLNYFVNLTNLEKMSYVMAICDSSTCTYRDGMQVETIGVVYAQTKSGIRVVMNTGDDILTDPDVPGTPYRIVGSRGLIVFSSWGGSYYILNSENPSGTVVKTGYYKESPHQRHLEVMAEMIDSGSVNYDVPESSLIALGLVEGAYISNRYRCKVTFPVDSFTPPSFNNWDPGMPYSGIGGGRDGSKL